MNRIILTGTPGCGKTSIIRGLEMKGYYVIEEAATDVIAFEQVNGIPQPWTNPKFIDTIILLQRHRQQHADCSTVDTQNPQQYYDRSPFCTYALARYLNYPPSPLLLEEIDRILSENIYAKDVFFIENLGFCTPTEARKISYEEALVFEKIHYETYHHFGFKCLKIPPAPLNERIERILS